ncbi:LapA family protein [Mesorhizobium huakuii]|uniref:hypothetical protein n=2 Tax=Mesorhizobium TaxID=68287 RepID=UPI0024E18E9E|nr:hypothetical protein [Mesorhizobium huakuii]
MDEVQLEGRAGFVRAPSLAGKSEIFGILRPAHSETGPLECGNVSGRGDMMRKVGLTIAFVLTGMAVLFALQNMTQIELTFLFWTLQTRRFVVVIASVMAGIAVGISLAFLLGIPRRDGSAD